MAKAKLKLVEFVWEGTDSKGKQVNGEQEAKSIAHVRTTLRRQGVRAKKIKRKPRPLFQFKKRVQPRDISFFTRQLAAMLGAGVPVAQSLSALSRGHDNPTMRNLLTSIRQEVESGTNLSNTLARHPVQFNRLYTSLVAAGEQSGTLDILLDKIASYQEKMEAIKGKIKSALIYPAVVVMVAIIVITILMIFVIPQFEQLFQGAGADLPTLTRMIVTASDWFRQWYWLFFLIIIGSIVFAIFSYKRSIKFQQTVDRIILKLPIFGIIIRKAILARYSRTLSTMFGAGVPLVDGLESVSKAVGNRVYENGIMDIRSEVSSGRSLESSMAMTGLFPAMVQQMVSTGEEAGELELMLNKVGEFYEREVDDAVAAISSLIEPIMIVVLGIIVGVIVVAMYLPIFKIAAVIA